MGTRGIIYIYLTFRGSRRRMTFMTLRDSRTELLRIRREFMKLKTSKAFDKLVFQLKQDPNIEDVTDSSPDFISADHCWPFLEYSLEVSININFENKKCSLTQPIVELVQEVNHSDPKTAKMTAHPFFTPISGQRRQQRKTP